MENSFLSYNEFIELNEKKYTKTVESSHLVDIDYDDDTKQLEIEFWNGNRYRYFDVPKSIFREFADEKTLLGKAGSAIKGLFKKDKTTFGTRFWSLIRRADFKYEKIK
jgi:hypothetical protein